LVQPAFELDEASAPFVAEICRRLDGIPLAIELAAARLKVLSVWQLVERLDQQFALLASRTRDVPPHQQTLQTTLDWSYDFLTRPEQVLFTRLSVFSGGFTLEAVEQVCSGGLVVRNQALDLLGRLVETSLVMASEGDQNRYRLLEPIAHYARMRLAETEDGDDLQERHAKFFVTFAEVAEEHLLARGQAQSVERLDVERYNLRSALEWLHGSGRTEEAMRLAGALRWFWVIRRDVSEGSGWFDRTLEHRQGIPPDVVAKALDGAGILAVMRIDYEAAERELTEALEIYRRLGDAKGEARQVYHLANVAWLQDDRERAERLLATAVELSRSSGEAWTEGWALAVQGTMARLRGDLAAAESSMSQSHDVFARFGGTLDLGWSYLRLGALARDRGNYGTASEHYTVGRELLLGAGDSLGIAHADAGLGAVEWLAGDHDAAIARYRSVLEGFSLAEDASNNVFELKTMIQGDPSREELRQIVQWNRERAQLIEGEQGAKAALAEYLYHMGKTAQRHGELARAREALAASLRLCIDATDIRGAAIAIAALAVITRVEGDARIAARLFGLADHLADVDRLQNWPPPDEPDYETAETAAGEELGTAFAAEHAAGASLELGDAAALVAPAT
jgi:tetratricopeptide (TPR) repeat protein